MKYEFRMPYSFNFLMIYTSIILFINKIIQKYGIFYQNIHLLNKKGNETPNYNGKTRPFLTMEFNIFIAIIIFW